MNLGLLCGVVVWVLGLASECLLCLAVWVSWFLCGGFNDDGGGGCL